MQSPEKSLGASAITKAPKLFSLYSDPKSLLYLNMKNHSSTFILTSSG